MTEQRFDRHRASLHPYHAFGTPLYKARLRQKSPHEDRLPPTAKNQTDPKTDQTQTSLTPPALIPPDDYFKNCKNFVTLSSTAIDLSNIHGSYQNTPEPIENCLNDIANTQSKMLRANGHCHQKISIAQHQLITAYFVLKSLSNPAYAPELPKHLRPALGVQALFHDASEYLSGDIPTPIKEYFNLAITLSSAAFGAKQAEKALTGVGIVVTEEMRLSLFENALKDAKEDPAMRVIANVENDFTRNIFNVLDLPQIQCPQKKVIKDADNKAFYLESFIDDDGRLSTIFENRETPDIGDTLGVSLTSAQETARNFKEAYVLLKKASKLSSEEFDEALPALKEKMTRLANIKPPKETPSRPVFGYSSDLKQTHNICFKHQIAARPHEL